MPPLRVLISGAGIAGPALAFWLGRLGHTCTIIERSPSLRANGQQIDLRKQGIEAARRMGILESIRAHLIDELGLQVVDSTGRQRALFARIEDDTAGRQGFTSQFEMLRGDLVKVLVDLTRGDAAEYRFGVSVDAFEQQDDGVKVTLSDGTNGVYDLLVAADGQGSRIRRMMLKDEAELDVTRHLGVNMAYFTIPRQPTDPDLAISYTATKQRLIFIRWHSQAQGQVNFGTMAHAAEFADALQQHDDAAQKELFARTFRDAGWQAERLVDEMNRTDDFYSHPMVQVRAGAWSRGRVVLVGDAGYAPTPLTGMGTSLALMGAYVLAGEISKSPDDLRAACEAYERELRPYVEKVQRIPKGLPGLAYPKGEFGVKVINALMGLTTTLGLDRALQHSLLKSNDPYRLPDYPALAA
ncbi:hypothetical protein JDV02_008258 [Purpureocillium takamizusanense]|uniref:FAD-binding domain-containing protein n=1 Tax=Purpureocillium takamizusanense TaxID=2060973 RepID=A0A9Q8QNA7_9HYPO|nr:uncharacterized protein JDV02_008258 [Purpureocillium takamizusanense]UNI22362.1 hypothetical protein JDV02_008258 [Purpureocillium takamizusanense]